MQKETEDLELRPLLRRLFQRGLILLAVGMSLGVLASLVIRNAVQKQFAQHLTQTVRNDLLIGNNAAALKILQQNIGANFSEISYREGTRLLFVLDAGPENAAPLLESSHQVPVCLNDEPNDCGTLLIFRYSLLTYIPHLLVAGALILLILALVYWIFRQHVAAYCREQLKNQKEAALGRLSARICHDLKLPGMIFQRVAYVQDFAQFLELRPQLQSHLQRLYAMIEKLKRADLEGLVQLQPHTLESRQLQSFLASIAPTPQQLDLAMPAHLRLYWDQEKVERSLANLVLNGFQAGARHARVVLQPRGADLIIQLENDGPPMPADRVQAFQSGDGRGLQSGLGLRIVQDTVLAHGGSCALESREGLTRFTLNFPNAVLEAQPAAPQDAPRAQPVERVLPEGGPCIWLDHDLMAIARAHIPQAAWEPFHWTSDPARLQQAQLVISRDEEWIGQAIEHRIPIIMAGPSDHDASWPAALQSRLRLLQLQNSLSTSSRTHVPLCSSSCQG